MSLYACSRLAVSHCGKVRRNIFHGTQNAFTLNLKNLPKDRVKHSILSRQHAREWTSGHFNYFKALNVYLSRFIMWNGRTKLICSFALFPASFKFFKQQKVDDSPPTHSMSDISPETLAAIPKDVFKKEALKSTKRKGNLLYQFVFAIYDTTMLFLRFLRIVFTFGPIFGLYPMSFISDGMRQRWLRLLLYAMENSGPTFVKLGQWASSRRDLFKDDLCDMFIKLHSHTRLHSWFMTRRKLTKAFGPRWKDLFVTFERKPIGSGCIAQVTSFVFVVYLVSTCA